MADITYTQFPIEADIVDISQMQTDISNAQTDILNLGQNKADKATTINGLSLAQNRTLYVQDVPSKNLLPNNAVTAEINGITFTVASDGTITATGTATATTLCNIVENYPLASGTYILSGCPAGGDSDSSYTLRVRFTDSATMYNDNGNGVTVNATGGKTIYALNIRIASGYAIPSGSPLVFRPMLRLSTVTDGSYVPYAKTNVELSNDTATTQVSSWTDGKSIKFANSKFLDAGGIVFGPSHQNLGAALDQVSSIVKSSTSSSMTATFSYTGNRYTGILLILNNTGTSAVYAVGFKKSQQSFVTKLAGGESSATMDENGTISVPLPTWSSAMLFAITDNTAFT